MKKLLFSLLFAFYMTFFMTSNTALAATGGVCGDLDCPVGQKEQKVTTAGTYDICTCVSDGSRRDEDIFGTIEPPIGVEEYNAASGQEIGLVLFLSNIIRIGTVIAGIWVMVNFILAGWSYITSSGDSKAHSEASSKMTFSLVGIAIIVGAYTIAAIIGLVIFGDASYILNPQFTGVGGIGGI